MDDGRGLRVAGDVVIAAEAGFAVVLKASMVATGLLLATMMVAEVILRYWVQAPFLGYEELSVLLGLWLYAVGMIYASRQNLHIAGGILAVLPIAPGVRKALKVLVMVVCVVVSAIYTYYGFMHTYETFGSTHTSSYLRWPYWIWTASLFAGFSLMTIYFVVGVFNAWRAPAPASDDQARC